MFSDIFSIFDSTFPTIYSYEGLFTRKIDRFCSLNQIFALATDFIIKTSNSSAFKNCLTPFSRNYSIELTTNKGILALNTSYKQNVRRSALFYFHFYCAKSASASLFESFVFRNNKT